MVRRLFAILLILSSAAAAGKKDSRQVDELDLGDLRPTQFNVGYDEVKVRMRTIQEEMAKGPAGFEAFLKSRPIPVVRGPGGVLYIVDGHHFSLALSKLGVKKVYVQEIHDYSDLKQKKFWKKMIEKNYVHLQDRGSQRSFGALAESVPELTDDPYRSLAWIVRRLGGYDKTGEPFQEFEWADFFRTRIPYRMSTPEERVRTIVNALILARSRKARQLGGHISSLKKKKCLASILMNAMEIDSPVDALLGTIGN